MKYYFILLNLNGFKDGNDYQKLYKELKTLELNAQPNIDMLYHLADESWIYKTNNDFISIDRINKKLANALSDDDELLIFEVKNMDLRNIYSNNTELMKWLKLK